MALKKRAAPSGAPEWIVTYGDMMSLLLCFFILLAAMANFDDQDKMMMSALESIRDALGTPGQRGWMTDEVLDFKSLLLQLQHPVPPDKPKSVGQSDVKGVDGQFYRVARVREGVSVSIGGPIIFRRCSAELEPESRFLISRIAERVRGYRHKIQVTGHTSAAPLPDDSPYPDKLALAHARARAVRDYLVELDVAPERIHIIAVGPYEPVVKHAYSEDNLAENRRVEILICEALVSDYDSTARSGVEAPAGNP